MKFKIQIIYILLIMLSSTLMAQQDSINPQLNTGKDVVGTASPSVFGGRKSKAFSIRYNVISGYDLQTTSNIAGVNDSEGRVRRLNELLVKLKVPLYLKPSTKVILGLKYQLEEYNFKNPDDLTNDVYVNLEDRNLHIMGLDLNMLQSISDKNYLIARAGLTFNGDFSEDEKSWWDYAKYEGTALFGWKKNPRVAFGVGATFSYAFGKPSIYPLFLYNHTFSDKWGIEALLPARISLRYNASPTSIFLAGAEFAGASYQININDPPFINYPYMELRRSDLLSKITYEQEVYDFLWVSVEGGYRHNLNLDIAEDNSFGSDVLLAQKVKGSMYFNFSLFIVLPKKLSTKYLKDNID